MTSQNTKCLRPKTQLSGLETKIGKMQAVLVSTIQQSSQSYLLREAKSLQFDQPQNQLWKQL